jgi:hypothetical protein
MKVLIAIVALSASFAVAQTTHGANSPVVAGVQGNVTIHNGQAAPPAPTVAPQAAPEPETIESLKRQHLIDNCRVAVAEANAAIGQIPIATKNAEDIAQKKRTEALDLIIKTKKDLGLPDQYVWNFDIGNFVIAPQVKQVNPDPKK